MALSPGTRLGPYEVGEVLGAGGMGEVYRARDTRLDRTVAIKILPPEFGSDAQFEERFEREARSIAALNHPHVCTLHDVGRQDGTHFIVMELVEGETLAERLQQGQIAVDEALTIARQIAEALEAAHEKGILHRDLKPANIKVTPGGSVKVLDFGLAKVLDATSSGSPVSNSPTLSRLATQAGLVMGTAAYMSPEQARGKPVDRRTDVWAFGCVLYEMLTSKPAFGGETVTDILGAVVHKDPDWTVLPADATPRLHELLRRCLQKDQKQRLRDMGDVQLEIDAARVDPAPIDTAAMNLQNAARARRWHGHLWLAWSAAALFALAGVAASLGWWQLATERPSVVRMSVELPPGLLQSSWGQAAVFSPDGSQMAYLAGTSVSDRQIYLRRLDELEGKALSGTTGAVTPFFSPDGQWIAFFSGNALRRVAISGGAPLVVADLGEGRGGAWGPDDTIVFTPTPSSGLFRVPSTGGTPEPLTTRDEKTERSHRWPQFLPGGDAILFTAGFRNRRWDESNIEILDLKTRLRKVVYQGATFARYLATGHLTFVRESTLFAIPFDLRELRVTGTPIPLLNGIRAQSAVDGSGVALVEVSGNGTLVYVPSDAIDTSLAKLSLVDRKGNVTPVTADQANFQFPRVSPDGTRVAVTRANPGSFVPHIWVYDLTRGNGRRLTLDEGVQDLSPIWTRDGKRITYTASSSLYWIPVDGSAPREPLTQSDFGQRPGSWSPDGRTLIFMQGGAQTGTDIWTLTLDGDRQPRSFLHGVAAEAHPEFSPDGRWVAYESNESGIYQVYVRAFPDSGSKWNPSAGPGRFPKWAADGRELIYSGTDKIMSVAVKTGSTSVFEYESPRELIPDISARRLGSPFPMWDVAQDGKRFVMVQDSQTGLTSPTHVTLIFNWFEDLKARLAQR